MSAQPIDDIEIYRFDVPLHEPFRIATMVSPSSANVLVRVRTRGGLEGWEASPFHAITGETQEVCLAAARDLRPLLLGRDALALESLAREMERFLPRTPTIRGAFDMALHDVAARAAGLPLYALLGGTRRPLETDLTISIGDPDGAGEKALAAKEKGFRTIKTKVGVGFEEDLRRLRSIRKALGPATALRIDANAGWSRPQAVRALGAFADLDIEFCEQPVAGHDVEGLRLVGERSPIPLMADESVFSPADAVRLIRERAAPYINVKVSKAGGIGGARRVASVAEAGGIPCMIGCMLETRLGITAAAHLALACPAFVFFDLDSFHDHSIDPIGGGLTASGGTIEVPETPGIGAVPDPAFLSRIERV